MTPPNLINAISELKEFTYDIFESYSEFMSNFSNTNKNEPESELGSK